MADQDDKAKADGDAGSDSLAEFKEMLAEQRERQTRLLHVQQFLKSPMFSDLGEEPLEVSDPPEAIEERKRELDYRIKVLMSLVSLMEDERKALDRTVSSQVEQANGTAPE